MLYIVRSIIELKTPLHCGGGEADGLLDAPICRDAFGLWYIPGSSIAGILRATVRQSFGRNAEKSLFGITDDEKGIASRVWCSDAVLIDFEGGFAWQAHVENREKKILSPSFVRDHVRIDVTTGTAENGGKFDEEYVPTGTRFALEITLNGWGKEPDKQDLQVFSTVIRELCDGRLHFGGKAGNGYGEYDVLYYEGRHFTLTNAKHMQQFLNLADEPQFTGECGNVWRPEQLSDTSKAGEGISGNIVIPLRSTGPLLIAGGSASEQADADMCFATTAFCNYKKKAFESRFVVPGSSIKGVLRHRIYDILKTLCIDNSETIIEKLFGNINNDHTCKGKIAVADAEIAIYGADIPQSQQIVQHVAIDRFTGGSIDGHLFNEAPLWADIQLYVQIRFDDLTELEAALLGHALLDLSTENLPIGSGVNRGNGRLHHLTSDPVDYNIFWKGNRISPQDADWHCILESLDYALQQAINTMEDYPRC